MGTLPDRAVHYQRAVGKVREPLPQGVELDVDRTGDVTGGVLGGGAHVDDGGALRLPVGDLMPLDRLLHSTDPVLGDVAEHVDRVLGRAERRRVGQLEIGELGCAQAAADRRGEDIDSLVDALATHA